MYNPVGTPAQTWAAAIAGSLSAHALVWTLLSLAERPTDRPQRRHADLTVYLVPPEPPPERVRPQSEPPDSASESTPTVPEEPPPEERPSETIAEAADEPAPVHEVPPSDETTPAVVDSPRARIDWNAEIAKAVVRVRPQAERYRTFGYPELPEDGGASAPRGEARLNPPGSIETTASGERRTWLNDQCYQSGYEPGSVLGEAHRFSNSFVICSPGKDEARDDMFAEIKPAYLR